MTPNEKYVLDTLAAVFCGTVNEEKDPPEEAPDGYITVGQKLIAVEVSRLVEPISNESGESLPRLTFDAPAQTIAGDVEAGIADHIPAGTHIFLIIGSPVRNIRKTKSKLQQAVVEMIKSGEDAKDVEICSNKISVNIYRDWPAEGTRVTSAIASMYSSSNITQNVEAILTDRITTKTLRRSCQSNPDEYWLALYNDYWIANAESYRAAYRKLQVPNDFDQIYVVDSYRRASPLW